MRSCGGDTAGETEASMTKRSKSSRRWLAEHASDVYVQRARAAGYRSRAAFKLEEIQRSERLLRPGMTIVDLGAAPGGWSQYAARVLRAHGRIVALDILPMDAIAGVEFIQEDFSGAGALRQLIGLLATDRPQLVMSDMAPNMTGIAEVDHDRAMHLVELALEFATEHLAAGGDFLVKVFQGRHFQPFVRQLRGLFTTVKVCKPQASRQRSPELYLLARGLKSPTRGT